MVLALPLLLLSQTPAPTLREIVDEPLASFSQRWPMQGFMRRKLDPTWIYMYQRKDFLLEAFFVHAVPTAPASAFRADFKGHEFDFHRDLALLGFDDENAILMQGKIVELKNVQGEVYDHEIHWKILGAQGYPKRFNIIELIQKANSHAIVFSTVGVRLN